MLSSAGSEMTFPGRPAQQGDRSFALMAAVAAIASLPLAAGNLLAMLATVHFNLGGMTNPLVLLHAGAGQAGLWRWSMVLDIVGYYLPIVPVILLLRASLRLRGPSWTDLFALCLLSYCLIGAIGGAELATALPTLMTQYATSPGHRSELLTVFTGFTDGIYRGMWNLLEEFLAGIGWVGFGVILRRGSDRWLGLFTMVLGIACLIDSAGTAMNADSVASIGLTVYLVLAPVWACWLGVRVLRRLSVDHSALPGHPDLSAARSERPASADHDTGKAWQA
jgi:hypothetical protein